MSTTTTRQALDRALQKITYGFYLVTARMEADELSTREKDWISAGTVSWMMQTSFEPAMVTIAVQKTSDLNETIGRSGSFAVAILGKEGRDLIADFANNNEISDGRINGVSYREGKKTGAPILDTGIAWLECEVVNSLSTQGDHVLFIGKVADSGLSDAEAEPLYEWETREHYGGTSEN